MQMETTITIATNFEELDNVAAQVGEFCAQNDRLELVEHRLALVLEELMANTINYGYDEDDTAPHQIEIALSCTGDNLDVVYRDDARPFDPTTKAPPDLSDDLDSRPVGGLGIHLVMTIMESVSYRREGDHNRLDMRMSLPA